MGSQMFWKDTWLGEEKLSGRSGRLFQNSLHKEEREIKKCSSRHDNKNLNSRVFNSAPNFDLE